MTKITKVSVAVLVSSSTLLAGASQMKLYDVKSGKVEYKSKGDGEILGQKILTVGKKRVIFDAYGATKLTEESKIDQHNFSGQKKVTKSHMMILTKGSILYEADLEQKRIYRMANPAFAMKGAMGDGQNMKQTGEEMMKKMGGKKTGTDKVLGYSCDVWETKGTKQCIYKGIPLRVETDMMGVKNSEIATKAEFDISLSKDDFKLPEFPIYDAEGNKLDKSKIDAMDKNQSAKMSQEMEDFSKYMGAAAGALEKSGFDTNNPNAKITKEQEKAVKKAMIDAMGGEKAILAKSKQEILRNAEKIPQAIKCIENANSLKAANACEREFNSEDPEYSTEWNDAIKANALKDMRTFENAIPCIKKANTLKAIQTCLPQE